MQYSSSALYDNKDCSSEFVYKYNDIIHLPHFFFCKMSFAVFVGADGFQLQHDWIIKELTLLFKNGEFNHTLFAPPSNYLINNIDLQTIRYTTTNLNGLNYQDGSIPYTNLEEYISKLENCAIYCYGQSSRKLIQQHLPFAMITDIQELGYQLPDKLKNSECGRNHNARYCSLSKAKAIKQFFHEHIDKD